MVIILLLLGDPLDCERSFGIHSHPKGGAMGFSGIRAVILIVVLVGSMWAVSRFDLPGWLVPVCLLTASVLLKGWEKQASGSS